MPVHLQRVTQVLLVMQLPSASVALMILHTIDG